MKILIYILFFQILVSCSSSDKKQTPSSNEKEPDIIWSVVSKQLKVRNSHNPKAKILGRLKYNEQVKELNRTPGLFQVDGRVSPWVYIDSSTGLKGWVFGGYLSLYDENYNPDMLLKKADLLKKENPDKAIEYYNKIKEYYPDKKFDKMYYTYKMKAEDGILFTNCYKERKEDFATGSPDEFKSLIIEGLEKKDKANLEKYASCEITYGCGDFFFPEEIPKLIKKTLTELNKKEKYKQKENYKENHHSIYTFSGSKKSFYFNLQHKDIGWIWTNICIFDK